MSQIIDFKTKTKEKIEQIQGSDKNSLKNYENLKIALDELGDDPIRDGLKPCEILESRAKNLGLKIQTSEFASQMDSRDEFRHFRDHFIFPRKLDLPNGKFENFPAIFFTSK